MPRQDSLRFNPTIGNGLGESETGVSLTIPIGVARSPQSDLTITAGYSLVVSRYYEIPSAVTLEIGLDSDLEIL